MTYNYPTAVKGFGRAGPSQILAGSGLGARPMMGYKAQIETPVRKRNWARGWNNKENYSGAGRISHPKKPQLIKKKITISIESNKSPTNYFTGRRRQKTGMVIEFKRHSCGFYESGIIVVQL